MGFTPLRKDKSIRVQKFPPGKSFAQKTNAPVRKSRAGAHGEETFS
jgi:hypothetical protein